MTADRAPGRPSRPAVGARILALGGSVAATLSLMAGMAWAAQHPTQATPVPTGTSVQPGTTVGQPGLQPTQAPPDTSSRGS
jgi:hypothetical protein